MWRIIFVKVSASLSGLLASLMGEGALESRFLQALWIGILPIWLEVGITLSTGVEPSLETRPAWKRADACADLIAFVLVPSFWFLGWVIREKSAFELVAIGAGVAAFVFCGFYRVIRFVRNGLVDGQFFVGLPVTYTGYLWLVLTVLIYTVGRASVFVASAALLAVAYAMVTNRIRIRRTQTRNDRA